MNHVDSATPIITLGDYHLIYRPNDEHLQIQKSLEETHLAFFTLQRVNSVGTFFAFVYVLL
ncbi:hypothetical protein [Moraxella oculi]|uniref:Uncharacterized protein n=1 Tax=Moraxella oculi TaxID=2940516 RepID=A0ABW8U601_9GAMM